MKIRLLSFLKCYFYTFISFAIGRSLFLLININLYNQSGGTDILRIFAHSLRIDASVGGYIMIIPGILLAISCFAAPKFLNYSFSIYWAVILLCISAIFVGNACLYSFWKFPLDISPFYYLQTPKEAFASTSIVFIIIGILGILLLTMLLFVLFYHRILKHTRNLKPERNFKGIITCILFLIFSAALFIPIRGGIGVAPTNTGMAYFSTNMPLNHAAVNPIFSLVESISRKQNLSDIFTVYTDEKCEALLKPLLDNKNYSIVSDSIFSTSRPHIVLIIVESLSSYFTESLGNCSGICSNIDSMAKNSLLFSNFYANSFRTDRGLVSILGGYPSLPTLSLMVYPRKTQAMPSLPNSLQKAGYQLSYYYGGNIHFTNMYSYLSACGFKNIISQKNFPTSLSRSKWGVLDEDLLAKVKSDWNNKTLLDQPSFTAIQTSSSHEPFEVPFHNPKAEDIRQNAISYADSCIGDFIKHIQSSPLGSKTVFIITADHAMHYPQSLTNYECLRYHIPLIIYGEPILKKGIDTTFSSQMDIAASILSALQLPHDEFVFSKNLFSKHSPHFAYFSHPGLWAILKHNSAIVYDYQGKIPTTKLGDNNITDTLLMQGQAYLQAIYKDVSSK